MIHQTAAKSDRENPDSWLPFSVHALDTAGVIQRLFDLWLPISVRDYISGSLGLGTDPDTSMEMAANYCRLLALLHDIGKLTPAFQSKIAPNINGYTDVLARSDIDLSMLFHVGKSPHAIAGEAILLSTGFPDAFCEIIGTHHGKHYDDPKNQIDDFTANYYGYRSCNQKIWSEMWEKWIQFALNDTFFTPDTLPQPDVPCQMLLSGLLIMADWIASNTTYFPYLPAGTVLADAAFAERLETAWNRLSLPDTWYADTNGADSAWFSSRFGFTPNAVQQCITEVVSTQTSAGIYILEAPMGIGKTEAALASAEILADKLHLGGVYFGLPTQATANGIFNRIHMWASKCDTDTHGIRLAHGMVDLNDEYRSIFCGTAANSGDESIIVHEWFEGRKQALLADFVVATVDQFLMTSLKQKHVMLRHLGLAGKVVIIDECHAYDAYMNVYLDHALTWMGAYGVPVIILSATLPPQRRDALIAAYLGASKKKSEPLQCASHAYPVLTWTNGQEVCRCSVPFDAPQKEIVVNRLSESGLVDSLNTFLCAGGCAAIIVNTVRYAQKLSVYLKEQLPDYEILCFHSRFLATDRAKIEQHLLARVGKQSKQADRDRLIVIGTQVLEQSLDLDFDYMVTELCPMDLLLQRSGRLHRHNRLRPEPLSKPMLSILEPDEPLHPIYDAWILQQTERLLPDTLLVPDCIPRLVSSVYDAKDPQDPLYCQYETNISNRKEKAKVYCINSRLLRNRYKKLLSDYLDDDVGHSKQAEASVRDTDETIEVILLQRLERQRFRIIGEETEFDPTLPLTESEAKQIARERLRLPRFFSQYHFTDTLNALNVMPERWRESKWLCGEMLLLLDENNQCELLGKKLRYTQRFGLSEIER